MSRAFPDGMHPLARRAAVEAMSGVFDAAFVRELLEDLLELDGESLRDAVRELIYLGTVLEEMERLDRSAPLFAMVESRRVIAALDRANASRLALGGESLILCARKFAKFEGAPIKADAQGEKKKLSELGPSRFAGLRLR
jgi:hypothetical protein